jgi:hypothetical protein
MFSVSSNPDLFNLQHLPKPHFQARTFLLGAEVAGLVFSINLFSVCMLTVAFVCDVCFAAIKHQPHVHKKLKSKAPTTYRFKNPEFKPQTPSLSRPK